MIAIKDALNPITWMVSLLGAAPLYLQLDLPAQVLLPTAFIVGIYGDRKGRFLVNSRIATIVSFLFFGLYLVQINLANVVQPAVNILALLLAIRLITEKSERNYLQIFVLSLFCLAASSLLSLHITFLPLLILLIFGVTTGLVLLTFYNHNPSLLLTKIELRYLLQTALTLPFASLLLMVCFFFILPRTEYPLWNFLNPGASASTGFSEVVRPGTFAQNSALKTTAFRAACKQLPSNSLYWRGTVLNTLDKNTWVRGEVPDEKTTISDGEKTSCTLYLPAKNNRFLLTLDRPLQLTGLPHKTAVDLVSQAQKPLQNGTTYQVFAAIYGKILVTKPGAGEIYLDTPTKISPKIRQIADDITRRSHSNSETVALLEGFFLHQKLSYATTDLPGENAPLEEFLFSKKRGYCEFFASSFALLLRLTGVPSRLVGGYHGGEYNNFGSYYLITEDMAHVWIEALVDGEWLRIDPSLLAINAQSALIAPRQRSLSFLRSASDAISYYWTQAVITYDMQKQFSLIRNTGKHLKTLSLQGIWNKQLIFTIIAAIGAILLIGWVSRRRKLCRHEKLLKMYLKAEIPKEIGLMELAEKLDDANCQKFAQLYGEIIYAQRQLTVENDTRMQTLISNIKKSAP